MRSRSSSASGASCRRSSGPSSPTASHSRIDPAAISRPAAGGGSSHVVDPVAPPKRNASALASASRDQQQFPAKRRRFGHRRIGRDHRQPARDHQHQPGDRHRGQRPRQGRDRQRAEQARPAADRAVRSRRPASPARADGRHWRPDKRSAMPPPIARNRTRPAPRPDCTIAAETAPLSAVRPILPSAITVSIRISAAPSRRG